MLIPLSDHNPRLRFPLVTVSLIVLNAVAFLVEVNAPDVQSLVMRAGAIPFEIVNRIDVPPRDLLPIPGSILTSMFLHGGVTHLIGNMWFLWIFGDNVEDALGRFRYLIFYFIVGTVAALAQCFSMPDSMTPMIGASGAVAGALGGYMMLFPRARILSLFIPFRIPAWIFLGMWFVLQFFMGAKSGVAWMAHVGGFLAGVGLVRLMARPRRRPAVDAEYLPPGRW